jgi:hypothetical protein
MTANRHGREFVDVDEPACTIAPQTPRTAGAAAHVRGNVRPSAVARRAAVAQPEV